LLRCMWRCSVFHLLLHFRAFIWLKSSWKESDDQQFHQYQQNKQAPLASNHYIQKRPWHMALEIQILVWDRHKNMAGLKLFLNVVSFNVSVNGILQLILFNCFIYLELSYFNMYYTLTYKVW
jgi:hypothetical protein